MEAAPTRVRRMIELLQERQTEIEEVKAGRITFNFSGELLKVEITRSEQLLSNEKKETSNANRKNH